MLLAAQLGALAAIDADLVSPEPGVPNESRNRVLFDADRGNPPRVDDVAGGHEHADFRVDRDDQRIVDFEQVMLTLGLAVLDLRERHLG